MKTDEEVIQDFKTFAYRLLEKYKPGDVTEIASGMINYKESFLVHCLENRHSLHMELVDYAIKIETDLKNATDRRKIEIEMLNIGKDVFVKFSDDYIEGRSFG